MKTQQTRALMCELIQLLGSHQAVVKALGVPKQNFSYWLNWAKHVPKGAEYAIKTLHQDIRMLQKDPFPQKAWGEEGEVYGIPTSPEPLDKEAVATLLQECKRRRQAEEELSVRLLNFNIFKNKRLAQAEATYHLPLRIGLINLMAYCDSSGGFHWHTAQLTEYLLPYTGVEVEKLLTAFSQCGVIQPDNTVSDDYWRVSVIKHFVREVPSLKERRA